MQTSPPPPKKIPCFILNKDLGLHVTDKIRKYLLAQSFQTLKSQSNYMLPPITQDLYFYAIFYSNIFKEIQEAFMWFSTLQPSTFQNIQWMTSE